MERTLTISRKVPAQFLSDILTSAIEGMMTRQWLDVSFVARAHAQPSPEFEECDEHSVVRLLDPLDLEEGSKPFDPKNFQPGFDHKQNSISLNTIHRGLERLFARTPDGSDWLVLPKRHDLRGAMLNLDASDFDSVDADVILQLGFFGDTIYG